MARFGKPGALDAARRHRRRHRHRGSTHGAHEHVGEYLAIERPSLLSFTWMSEKTDHQRTVVTIEFHERGAGTELVLTHRRLPPAMVEGHRRGWTDIVRLLDEALTGR